MLTWCHHFFFNEAMQFNLKDFEILSFCNINFVWSTARRISTFSAVALQPGIKLRCHFIFKSSTVTSAKYSNPIRVSHLIPSQC